MSVLAHYVERLEQSMERNQAILETDIREFEDLCDRGVELGDATVLRHADKSFKRALARFQEIEQLKQVLRGPKYRGLVTGVAQRETILLAIRGRAQFSRTLVPMDRQAQMFWEYLNYGLALLGLLVVWLVRRRSNRQAQQRYAALLRGV